MPRGDLLCVVAGLLVILLTAVVVRSFQKQSELLKLQNLLLVRQEQQENTVKILLQGVGKSTRSQITTVELSSIRDQLATTRIELTALVAQATHLQEKLVETELRIKKQTESSFRSIESIIGLYAQLSVTQRMPPLEGAISAQLMLILVELLRQRRPQLIVKLGAGPSTIWLAAAIRQFGLNARLIVLEHDEVAVKASRALLSEHNLLPWVNVRHARLTVYQLPQGTWKWYERNVWADLRDVELLLLHSSVANIDGDGCFPALPLLRDTLAKASVVILGTGVIDADQRAGHHCIEELPHFFSLNLPEQTGAVFYRGSVPVL
ncbi:MAG: hypothetical protein ACRCTR_02045 [Actinomycetota bacterium]